MTKTQRKEVPIILQKMSRIMILTDLSDPVNKMSDNFKICPKTTLKCILESYFSLNLLILNLADRSCL